ncbi:MAG: hypothetical protein AB3N28_12765 [Kordiimonas sp.]
MTTAAVIDPRSVPKSSLSWPAAFRLRPASVPINEYAENVESNAGDIEALINLCSEVGRHNQGLVPLGFATPHSMPPAVVSAFANPAPEWHFAPTGLAHIAVAETLKGALALGAEQYGQFLKDTEQPACRVSFVMERFLVKGSFSDITDTEVFSACYNTVDYTVMHQLARGLSDTESDGFVYDVESQKYAVVLKPECLSGHAEERAIALEWDGMQFSRYFDYRDLFWSDLS